MKSTRGHTWNLHIANPDALIVRYNARRAAANRVFDVEYALSLGDNAVPALVGSLEALSPPERARIAYGLVTREAVRPNDWRAWSLARARACRAYAAHEETLRLLAATIEAEENPRTTTLLTSQ